MTERDILPGNQSLPPIRDILLGPETVIYNQLPQQGIDIRLPSAGVGPFKMAATDHTSRARQQSVWPMNAPDCTRQDLEMPSTTIGTGLPNFHVTLEPRAISSVHPAALFSLSNNEPRMDRRPSELAGLKTAGLPSEARERGSGLAIQVGHRSRRQKRIYRHKFFSDSIGQDEYRFIDALVSSLSQTRLAAQAITMFAEMYEKRVSLQSGPFNVPECLPTGEEVSDMLSYADFIGRALQQLRPLHSMCAVTAAVEQTSAFEPMKYWMVDCSRSAEGAYDVGAHLVSRPLAATPVKAEARAACPVDTRFRVRLWPLAAGVQVDLRAEIGRLRRSGERNEALLDALSCTDDADTYNTVAQRLMDSTVTRDSIYNDLPDHLKAVGQPEPAPAAVVAPSSPHHSPATSYAAATSSSIRPVTCLHYHGALPASSSVTDSNESSGITSERRLSGDAQSETNFLKTPASAAGFVSLGTGGAVIDRGGKDEADRSLDPNWMACYQY
ncbi:hypothetical protein Purlil1_13571 [Purpureocillium lilacinum]|uniref:Uncharacterized protein n=1 Tax=Purpureocillium lilacinum TaxID=33203 RepID=A0ABR0BDP4_PURLI|nr:hypothetical protein Purlil1_13571 [Purpureocillium lilacinum]